MNKSAIIFYKKKLLNQQKINDIKRCKRNQCIYLKNNENDFCCDLCKMNGEHNENCEKNFIDKQYIFKNYIPKNNSFNKNIKIYINEEIINNLINSDCNFHFRTGLKYNEGLKLNNFNNLYTLQNKSKLYLIEDGIIDNNFISFRNSSNTINLDPFDHQEKKRTLKSNYSIYNNVICLAGRNGTQYYHFLYDYLIRLFLFKELNIDISHMFIYVNSKTSYISELIKFIGLNPDNIISGDIQFKNLYIPDFYTGYYFDSLDALLWFKNNFIQKSNKKNKVILIKRNHTRVLKNFNELLNIIKNYSVEKNLELYIHDDSKLPSIEEQFVAFSQAVLVCGSHGACLNSIIACDENTKIIELMDNSWNGYEFMKLSWLLNLNYYGISTHNFVVDCKNILKIINNEI